VTTSEHHTRAARQFRLTDTPRGVPVHRTTPAASGQHRSGRTGLTNQERFMDLVLKPLQEKTEAL